jgi:AraC family cel operon transcriptional repressor
MDISTCILASNCGVEADDLEYINIKRIHYACELLTDHRHDVAEVCYMTGFNNLSHFYAVFRRICRCTPGDLMKRTQG